MESSKAKTQSSSDADKESVSDDECVKETHSLLREVHQAIFSEQVCSCLISFLLHSSNIFGFYDHLTAVRSFVVGI